MVTNRTGSTMMKARGFKYIYISFNLHFSYFASIGFLKTFYFTKPPNEYWSHVLSESYFYFLFFGSAQLRFSCAVKYKRMKSEISTKR